jgi:hypothetical protein
MAMNVESARAAAQVFDFRSFLLTALQTNQDVTGLAGTAIDAADESAASEPSAVDAAVDDQWVAWTDAGAESAWIDAELMTDWGAAAERLGWRG